MQLHICLIFRSKKRQVMGGNAMTRLGIRSTWDAENNVLEFNIFFYVQVQLQLHTIYLRYTVIHISTIYWYFWPKLLSFAYPSTSKDGRGLKMHEKFEFVWLMCCYVKFGHSEKAKKIRNNHPYFWRTMWVASKKWEIVSNFCGQPRFIRTFRNWIVK